MENNNHFRLFLAGHITPFLGFLLLSSEGWDVKTGHTVQWWFLLVLLTVVYVALVAPYFLDSWRESRRRVRVAKESKHGLILPEDYKRNTGRFTAAVRFLRPFLVVAGTLCVFGAMASYVTYRLAAEKHGDLGLEYRVLRVTRTTWHLTTPDEARSIQADVLIVNRSPRDMVLEASLRGEFEAADGTPMNIVAIGRWFDLGKGPILPESIGSSRTFSLPHESAVEKSVLFDLPTDVGIDHHDWKSFDHDVLRLWVLDRVTGETIRGPFDGHPLDNQRPYLQITQTEMAKPAPEKGSVYVIDTDVIGAASGLKEILGADELKRMKEDGKESLSLTRESLQKARGFLDTQANAWLAGQIPIATFRGNIDGLAMHLEAIFSVVPNDFAQRFEAGRKSIDRLRVVEFPPSFPADEGEAEWREYVVTRDLIDEFISQLDSE
jgi:hypothetical protein